MQTTRSVIDRFVSGRTLAVVGVSAAGRGFGSSAYRELKKRGYRVLAVHPTARAIQGDACWPRLADLPEPVDGVFVAVRPDRAGQIVREAADAGIRRVWLQQGADSPEVLELCERLGVEAVHGHCILMFTEPVGSVHAFHRWMLRVLGRLPRA